jgi:type I restriction enzyme M protein
VSIVQNKSQREDVGKWVATLEAALTSTLSSTESNSLIREIFAAFLLLRWADLQDAEQEAMAVFEDRPYQPLLPEPLQWRHWAHLDDPYAIADRLHDLTRYVRGFRGDSPPPIAAYLHALAAPLQRMLEVNFVYLHDLVHWVSELPFETRGERRSLLDLFDEVIAETSTPYEGHYTTPINIARLVATLANPQPGERVYDPCFGSGNFLVAAWQQAEHNRTDQHSPGTLLEVSGIEKNTNTFLIGLTRMLLAGIDAPRLELGNSLERESLSSPGREGFDVVLANPPIGVKTSLDTGRHHQYAILTPDSVGLFIQHALSQLKPHGRAVIVVAEGFLFRGGAERDLRRHLLEQGQIEFVVGLPAGVFSPYTGVKCSLLVLNRQGGASRVRMLDATQLFEQRSGKKAPVIREEIIKSLANELRRPEPRRPTKGFEEDTPDRGMISRLSWELSVNELAAAEWDLSPRRREKGGLDELLASIQDALGANGTVAALSSVTQVMAGRAIKSTDLVDEPPNGRAMGYVRIRDLTQGKVGRSTSWLRPELASIEQRWALLPGDVLVSKSGTIGKAALVRNGAVGAVAANGLYVLRPDRERLDAGFLMAYLASPVCQNWLAAQSRGAVIQHLNRAVLDGLPVPLPPLQIQDRAAAQFREFGTDVLAFLAQTTRSAESDRLTTWLAELNSKIPSFVAGLEDTPALSLFEPLVAMASMAQRWLAEEQVGSQSARWLQPLSNTLLPMAGVAQIPTGPALLNVLQDGERGLQIVLEAATGHLPIESLARSIAERLRDWLRTVIADLVDDVSLRVCSSPDALVAGSFAEFLVELANEGALPLRGLSVETSPDWGVAQVPYLAERSMLAINLRGDVPKQGDQLTLLLNWQARTLAGGSVNGEIELVIRVTDPEVPATMPSTELGGSPYVTGSPLEPQHGHDVFFGREALIGQISRQIATHGNVVLLEGNRRAGKTSILKHLEGRTAIPGWLAVYSSLQGAEGASLVVGVPTQEVFLIMAIEIAKSLTKLGIDVPLPNGQFIAAGKPALGVARACRQGIGSESPFADFRDYLELILSILEPLNLGLVLMLDEFDKLQEGIDNGVTSPQVPENIRFLIQTYPKFSAILTGSRRLKRLREQYWSALYGLGTSIPVTALDTHSARSVVTEPVRDKLTFSNEAVERVIEITARQPYLMQCLCNRVFDYAVQTKSRSITLGVVNASANILVRDNEHFASLWDYAGLGPETGRQRRQLVLLLCAQSFKQGTHINLGTLHEQLAQTGVDVNDEALDIDLAYLRELELIEFSGEIGDGQYRLAIPLMADWIEQQQDADMVTSRARTEAEEENA